MSKKTGSKGTKRARGSKASAMDLTMRRRPLAGRDVTGGRDNRTYTLYVTTPDGSQPLGASAATVTGRRGLSGAS